MLVQRIHQVSLDESLSQVVTWTLALDVALYVLARSIPVLGWLIGAVVTFAGLGAMWMLYRERRRTPAPA